MKSKSKYAFLVLAFCASGFGLPSLAQVIDSDPVYPSGPANKIKEKYSMVNTEEVTGPPSLSGSPFLKLKGRVISAPTEYVIIPDRPMLFGIPRRSDDRVRGKTLHINQGFGGAVLY